MRSRGGTFLQRFSAFLLTYVVYWGLGLSETAPLTIVLLQASVSIAVDMLPIPGAQGITEAMYGAGFSEGIYGTIFNAFPVPLQRHQLLLYYAGEPLRYLFVLVPGYQEKRESFVKVLSCMENEDILDVDHYDLHKEKGMKGNTVLSGSEINFRIGK